MKRLTIQEIKYKTTQIANGYICISERYKNSRETNLVFKCNSGHIFYRKWKHFSGGRLCPKCKNNYKKNINDIIKFSEKNNYKCLSTIYINAKTKLLFKCSQNHKFKMTWNSFQRGNRCPICHYINFLKEGHWNWKGGISYKPYCKIFKDKEFKEFIKQRDNYSCQNKDCWGTSKRLCIHHINYNKKDCCLTNLITLCTSCNIRANYNRKWWENWYKI